MSKKSNEEAFSSDSEYSDYDDEGSDFDDDGFSDPENDDYVDVDEDDDYAYSDENDDLLFEPDEIEEKKVALDEKTIVEEQVKQIKNIADPLGLTSEVAAFLLRYFNWNTDKLMEAMFNNREKTLKEAKIDINDLNESKKIYKPKGNMCQTCFCQLKKSDKIALKCQHAFCNECWVNYLTFRIKEQRVDDLFCQSYQCYERVTEGFLKEVVDEENYKKYQWTLAKSFVSQNPENAWCPAPNCDRACTKGMIQRGTNVECSCGHRFCFNCKEEAHSPANCDDVAVWLKKCKDDSETFNWLMANTKPCPKCKNLIEKNGGCNHMTCRKNSGGCGYEFCWICLGDWAKHGTSYYKCNHYDPNKHDNKKAKDSKMALERYLHYFQRYQNHEKSLSFEKQLTEKTKKKMTSMQESKDVNFIDVSFMEDAAKQLCHCRLVLKWTYVFAYSLIDFSKAKELFEFVQEQLEVTTEKLSEITERDIVKIDKMEAVNTTRIAKKKLEHLFDTVESGLPEGMIKGHENDIIEEKKVLKNADEN
ncbi:e3 ubiquitin-protein ligase ari5-related [Anaeramoeba flamelloides]|uniref:RBR-type E3 ubiquitin transferase n=1 Tax=Anaeramoeba flamelloides TaxID=1746091 RepID=A0ABQ8XUV8_9EUKA|nr:e3 ubiquitin-protein ligase ari5-related [Anaeramoeba flamelloides]